MGRHRKYTPEQAVEVNRLQARQRYHAKKALPHTRLHQNTYIRSRAEGIAFSLSADDFFIPPLCPIYNIPLAFDGDKENEPTIVRLNPSLPYVFTNCWVVSFKAFRRKQDCSADDLLTLAKAIMELERRAKEG